MSQFSLIQKFNLTFKQKIQEPASYEDYVVMWGFARIMQRPDIGEEIRQEMERINPPLHPQLWDNEPKPPVLRQ